MESDNTENMAMVTKDNTDKKNDDGVKACKFYLGFQCQSRIKSINYPLFQLKAEMSLLNGCGVIVGCIIGRNDHQLTLSKSLSSNQF